MEHKPKFYRARFKYLGATGNLIKEYVTVMFDDNNHEVEPVLVSNRLFLTDKEIDFKDIPAILLRKYKDKYLYLYKDAVHASYNGLLGMMNYFSNVKYNEVRLRKQEKLKQNKSSEQNSEIDNS